MSYRLWKYYDRKLFGNAGINDNFIVDYMLGSLNEMCNFTQKYGYDIYLNAEERSKLTGVPKNWHNTEYFIKADILSEYGFPFPLIYDVFGLCVLYTLNKTEINTKIDAVTSYFMCDEYHEKVSDGYGILIAGEYESGNPRYNGMGWSPHISGWFNIKKYFEDGNIARLLFFTEYITKYQAIYKTKWYVNLLAYLEKYKTENETYIFPKEWLPEKSGYAVQGFHMSYGENRRKKLWLEIESTFYMQLVQQGI